MGNVTADLQIWTPDSLDTMEPDTYLATMAQSIEDGTGARLRLQEIAVGLKASGNGYTIPSTTATIPYSVTATLADFNKGFTFAAGVATVQTNGMYLVTASLGLGGYYSARGVNVAIKKNGNIFAQSEVPSVSPIWVNAQATSVINCVAGDTISASGYLTGAGGGTATSQNNTTYISIGMIQAIPV